MREWFSQLPSKIVEFWKKYTKRQKALFFSVLAAVLVAVIALVAILNRTSYVVLSTFEDTATAAQAANLLEDNSITYKVSDDALKIEVDENQVSQARLLLGENGIGTNNGQSDYDSLFNNSFNTTDSEKKLKAKLYKQSEMERDIASMQGVTKASVTINLPESTNTVYASDQTASVSIMLTINGDYNQESTNAIVEYAKTCVGNSDTKAITIVDNKGELLFSGQNSTTSASPVIMVQQQVEEYYNSKLWNLMVNSGVYDEVSVSANLDVNISQQEIEDIKYYSNDEDDTGPKSSHYYYLAENTDGTGGVVGTMIVAMQKGVARGIFSNESGLGSAPIAAAAAKTKEPVRQGLVSMTGTFIDTIIICTMTGLSIVLTGAWQQEGLEGVQVTTYAFQEGLPISEQVAAFLLMLCLVFFAFTTILGWDYYSERCLEYLSGKHKKAILVYRWLYILAVFIGPYMTVKAVWTIADIFNGLMAIPNMIAIFALSGVVVKETKDFFKRHAEQNQFK